MISYDQYRIRCCCCSHCRYKYNNTNNNNNTTEKKNTKKEKITQRISFVACFNMCIRRSNISTRMHVMNHLSKHLYIENILFKYIMCSPKEINFSFSFVAQHILFFFAADSSSLME